MFLSMIFLFMICQIVPCIPVDYEGAAVTLGKWYEQGHTCVAAIVVRSKEFLPGR